MTLAALTISEQMPSCPPGSVLALESAFGMNMDTDEGSATCSPRLRYVFPLSYGGVLSDGEPVGQDLGGPIVWACLAVGFAKEMQAKSA